MLSTLPSSFGGGSMLSCLVLVSHRLFPPEDNQIDKTPLSDLMERLQVP